MKRTRHVLGVFVAAFVLCGCTSQDDTTSDEGLFPVRPKGSEEVRKEVEHQGTGTITGIVTYDGEPPAMPDLAGALTHDDKSRCVQGNIKDPTWVVKGSNGPIANVVVWVQPPKGTYFKKPEDALKTWKDTVPVDQPYCAFEPHVVVLYPQYYDGKKLVSTGQVFKVLNTSPIGHNIKMGGSSDKNSLINATLPAKTGFYDFDNVRVDQRELSMNCDIHKFMTGYALTFDHPYAIVTGEDGKFTIKNVPAGVELEFRAFHEGVKPKRFPPNVAGGAKFTLKPGETKTLDFKIK